MLLGLFSEELIIGRSFASENGLGLTIKQQALTRHGLILVRGYYRKDFCVEFFFFFGGGGYYRNFTVSSSSKVSKPSVVKVSLNRIINFCMQWLKSCRNVKFTCFCTCLLMHAVLVKNQYWMAVINQAILAQTVINDFVRTPQSHIPWFYCTYFTFSPNKYSPVVI